MLDLRAAHRLLAAEQKKRVQPSLGRDLEGDVLEAGFDKQKDPELQKIELHLRKANVFFTLSQGHLYHKSNVHDIVRETEICAEELNNLHYKLRIQPGILSRQNFAVKGNEGIVLQRLG